MIARVVEEVPERVRRLVIQNAFVPAAGNCLLDEVPPHYRAMFEMAAASDDHTLDMPLPVWREAFIQDGDLALAGRSHALLSPEPYQPFCDKLDLTRFYALEIPHSYLNATEDTALPPGEWEWHPRMSSRLGPYRLVRMPGSHEVVYSTPDLLADKIREASRD